MKPNDKAIEAARAEILLAMAERNSIIAGVPYYDEFDASEAVEHAKVALDAAYAAQFQSEDYAGLIARLRDWGAMNYKICNEAADALEAVLAGREAWKGRQEATAAILKRVETERDALLARLAPVGNDELVEIAADAIRRNKFERTGRLDCFDPSNLTLEELGEGRAAISAIRPHIEAAERERCAKRILETNWVDADPEDIAAAIRSGK